LIEELNEEKLMKNPSMEFCEGFFRRQNAKRKKRYRIESST